MYGLTRVRAGGLILDATPHTFAATPLRDGPDVSWFNRCLPGDDQGQDGACVLFAIGSWAEIVHGTTIPSADRLDLYGRTLRKLGRGDGGLSFAEGWEAARLQHGAVAQRWVGMTF